MRRLPVCLSGDEARSRLRRRSRLDWILRRHGGEREGRVELIWVPHCLFTFEMETARDFGETTVSVDACSGAFAIFQMEEDLLDAPAGDGEVLSSLLLPEEAEKRGRDKLLQAIMRRRGSQGPKPAPGRLLRSETVLFPFWVKYVHRGKDRLDIRLLNAATGEAGGNQTRVGVLHAFVATSRR